MTESHDAQNPDEDATAKPNKPPVKDRAVAAAKRNKGLLVGAAVGTAIVPGLGTVIGGALGSLWD